MSTICAVSTPLAQGGLSVIRISGDNAIDIAEKIFSPFGEKQVRAMSGHTCAYGKVMNPENNRQIDDAVLTVFIAPKSYTGENAAEISCHGGVYITKEILRLCIAQGAVLAEKGEFTKRAFLNGKLSLTQAESVMELISAQGEYALRSANLTREGRLFKDISAAAKELVRILGELGAWVDYPEEDLPDVEESALSESLSQILTVVNRILNDYDNGLLLRNGVDTVIAGKPNVGKSTLMNMLLGYDRSIVTDIAGTTRDVIEETAKLGELTLKLSDTAGIRDTENKVEQLGVELARKRIENCSLVMAVFDTSRPLDDEDIELLEYIYRLKKNLIIILNKSDLEPCIKPDIMKKYSPHIITISAKFNEGMEEIQKTAEKIFSLNNYDPDSTIFANERQKSCAETAKQYIEKALEALKTGATLDAVTVTIDYAANALLELTGEKASEAVVNEVFSKFCVGK
ncbi:MAG: tRNA uridine-5-carboxymethylaminomethyl(34) synthesis GTPase MnmE [Ruminococcus sp.]|nr:tRNA uridine-5-carboxymethylaminomethyl(34) synthesis GTPase MnmE [Ruminococcus sp.]